MQTWLWGVTYPDFMNALVPLASQPVEVAGRNWITRRMLIDMIRNDPEWNGGNYTKQPRSLQAAHVYFSMATSGGTQALYKAAPTQENADQLVNQRLGQKSTADANDVIYQYEASRGYNPAPQLESIKARILAINSADDARKDAAMERPVWPSCGSNIWQSCCNQVRKQQNNGTGLFLISPVGELIT